MKCTLNGELTIARAAEIKAELLQAVAGNGPFKLDTAGVTEVDAAGLQLLLAAMNSAASRKNPVVFPPEARGTAVSDALELVGLASSDWNNKDSGNG